MENSLLGQGLRPVVVGGSGDLEVAEDDGNLLLLALPVDERGHEGVVDADLNAQHLREQGDLQLVAPLSPAEPAQVALQVFVDVLNLLLGLGRALDVASEALSEGAVREPRGALDRRVEAVSVRGRPGHFQPVLGEDLGEPPDFPLFAVDEFGLHVLVHFPLELGVAPERLFGPFCLLCLGLVVLADVGEHF